MDSKIPDDPDALLQRIPTAEGLRAAGFPVSPKTLQTMATRGGGPPFLKFGKHVLYRWKDALAWAKARLSEPRSSTSEATRFAEFDTPKLPPGRGRRRKLGAEAP
jgi:hypothetical protein